MNFNSRTAFLISLVVLVASSVNCRAQEQPQRSITKLSGDLYRAQNDQHFTVFLVTRDGIILTDPINREFSAWLKGELDDRFQVPVKYVLYSHHHWDHASGGAVFAETAQFLGHENMLSRLSLPPSDTSLPAEAGCLLCRGAGNSLRRGVSICFRYNSGTDASCSGGIFPAIFGLPIAAGT